MQRIKCNFRSCLDQIGGLSNAGKVSIVDGKCQSIAWSRDSMKSAVPPMEWRRGSMMNKKTGFEIILGGEYHGY
ncbi:hypothetical protein [Sporomusa sp. KB1]|jgi:hypothetical protein|uniref:hypothetical protein n=1 Tax=Sporomusa sp. KB1 TaxID=943346 RepID=UPI0011A4244A|nr:hypothetical protein [Sporomusa sp. KB1]TWH46217.1 hypothetical protein Salpa_2180 [Sporomusa sp. KB1]